MSRWSRNAIFLIVAVALVVAPSTAHAYVGPGGVLTAMGAMLALLTAIVAAFAGFLWYPLKRVVSWLRRARRPANGRESVPPLSSETPGK